AASMPGWRGSSRWTATRRPCPGSTPCRLWPNCLTRRAHEAAAQPGHPGRRSLAFVRVDAVLLRHHTLDACERTSRRRGLGRRRRRAVRLLAFAPRPGAGLLAHEAGAAGQGAGFAERRWRVLHQGRRPPGHSRRARLFLQQGQGQTVQGGRSGPARRPQTAENRRPGHYARRPARPGAPDGRRPAADGQDVRRPGPVHRPVVQAGEATEQLGQGGPAPAVRTGRHCLGQGLVSPRRRSGRGRRRLDRAHERRRGARRRYHRSGARLSVAFSPALIVYQLLTRLLEPLAPRLLDARVRKGKEDPARVDERLGQPGMARPDGPLGWVHGVGVAEALSILPRAERTRKDRPDVTVLVTTGTLTSAQVLASRLPRGVIHQFAPVDGPSAVAAFLDHWRPNVGVFVESELWPNLLTTAQKRGVPLALVSARITDKTAQGWRKAPGMARALMNGFSHVWPQDQDSADRLTALGARVDGQVNLKLSGEPLP